MDAVIAVDAMVSPVVVVLITGAANALIPNALVVVPLIGMGVVIAVDAMVSPAALARVSQAVIPKDLAKGTRLGVNGVAAVVVTSLDRESRKARNTRLLHPLALASGAVFEV